MATLDSRPALRWLAPAAFLLVVGGSSLVATSATADPKLPDITAEQLLVDLQESKVDGLSGTVLQRADLGLPALPTSGHGDSTDFSSLLSGEHELRVWYATPGKSRVAVTGDFGETDLITNGTDLWTWSSKTKEVTHATVPDHGDPAPSDVPSTDVPKTPQEAAAKILASIDPSTTVSVDSVVDVAGRAAYELVLRPKDNRSLLTEARIAVDGETRSPLRVQVFAKQRTVLDVGYTDVSFTRPEDSTFEFTPPPGSEVTEKTLPDDKSPGERDEARETSEGVTTVGSGWTTVAVSEIAGDPAPAGEELQSVLDQLPRVSGTWGSGRLLSGTAFSAVLTDDGRMAVGAVAPELLYQALER